MDHVFVGVTKVPRSRTPHGQSDSVALRPRSLRVVVAKSFPPFDCVVSARTQEYGAITRGALSKTSGHVFDHVFIFMKVIIPGGTGQIGRILSRAFAAAGDEVVVLTRNPVASSSYRSVCWDGKTLCDWTRELEGADVVINLAGKSVNCRYGKENRREILESRTNSVHAIRRALENAKQPPRIWLQAATATIYAHRFDAPNDEFAGIIGGNEPKAPDTWRFSIDVAKAWEKAVTEFGPLPKTRTVIMRSAMTMSPDRGGIFAHLLGVVRFGIGGPTAGGRQFVSWIHEADFVKAVQFLIGNADINGVVNICSPNPLPNSEFMRELRRAWGTRFAFPTPRWMLEIGTFLMRTESELVLKSRRVIPTKLLQHGFEFRFPYWLDAATELCTRYRKTGGQDCAITRLNYN